MYDHLDELDPQDREQLLAFETFLIQIGEKPPLTGDKLARLHPELQRWALGEDQSPY